jgi:hypothetical protein
MPQLEGLVRFFQISHYLPVVQEVDEKPLRVACSIPQLPGLCGVLSRQHGLSNFAVVEPQIRPGHCELGIDFDSALKKRRARGGADFALT